MRLLYCWSRASAACLRAPLGFEMRLTGCVQFDIACALGGRAEAVKAKLPAMATIPALRSRKAPKIGCSVLPFSLF
eukprot:5873649-Prymnesium_polylepis.1